jgi:hypothetical protein
VAAETGEVASRTEWNPDQATAMNPFISRYLFGCRKRGRRVAAVIFYPTGEVTVRRNYETAASEEPSDAAAPGPDGAGR